MGKTEDITLKHSLCSKEVGSSLTIDWEGSCKVSNLKGGDIHIKADREGLLSLATLLVSFAQEKVPSGYHFHLDEFTALEEGSVEVILERE